MSSSKSLIAINCTNPSQCRKSNSQKLHFANHFFSFNKLHLNSFLIHVQLNTKKWSTFYNTCIHRNSGICMSSHVMPTIIRLKFFCEKLNSNTTFLILWLLMEFIRAIYLCLTNSQLAYVEFLEWGYSI